MHVHGSVFVASCLSQGLDRTIEYKNVKIKLKRSLFAMMITDQKPWLNGFMFELFEMEFHHENDQTMTVLLAHAFFCEFDITV